MPVGVAPVEPYVPCERKHPSLGNVNVSGRPVEVVPHGPSDVGIRGTQAGEQERRLIVEVVVPYFGRPDTGARIAEDIARRLVVQVCPEAQVRQNGKLVTPREPGT